MSIVDTTTPAIERAGAARKVTANGTAWYAVQVKRFEEHRVVRFLAMRPIPMPLEAIEAIRARVGELGFVRLGVRFAAGG